MRTLWSPPEGYPIAILDGDVHIPDFQHVMEGATFPEAAAYIHSDLRRRRAESAYYPFPSSVSSIADVMPEASILIVPTHGWDDPAPLENSEEE